MSTEKVSQPRQSPLPIAAGSLVAGKYRVDGMLGRGGMGVVVAATDLELERKVAIKFVERTDEQAAARFLREARAAARMDSEHVTRVFEVSRLDSSTPFIVMERLEGEDLAKLLAAGRLPVAEAVCYLMQVCEALAQAHAARIVHRDLKPGNLFLHQRSDGSRVVKVLDFGISKTLEGTVLTESQAIVGSPQYLAPEQIERPEKVDHRTDIWALGVVAHELISGERPFRGATMVELCMNILASDPPRLAGSVPGISEGLDAVLRRCLTKSMDARWDSVAQLAEALAPFSEADGARLLPAIQRAAARPITTPATPQTPIDAARSIGRRDGAMEDTVDNGLEQRASRGSSREGRVMFLAIAILLVTAIAMVVRRPASDVPQPAAVSAGEMGPEVATAAAAPAPTEPAAPALVDEPIAAPPTAPTEPAGSPAAIAPEPAASPKRAEPAPKSTKPKAHAAARAPAEEQAAPQATPAAPAAGPEPPSCRVLDVIENGRRVEPAAGRVTFEWARRLCQNRPHRGAAPYSLSDSGISVKCACD